VTNGIAHKIQKKTVIHYHDKTQTIVAVRTSLWVNLGKGCSSYCQQFYTKLCEGTEDQKA
jgi:hypothetical protein